MNSSAGSRSSGRRDAEHERRGGSHAGRRGPRRGRRRPRRPGPPRDRAPSACPCRTRRVRRSRGCPARPRRAPRAREVPDHDGVHHPHQHHADLDDDHRHRQPQHGAEVLPPGQEPTGGCFDRVHSGSAGRDGGRGVARRREQALGEVQPLGELGHLLAERVYLVGPAPRCCGRRRLRDPSGSRGGPGRRGNRRRRRR